MITPKNDQGLPSPLIHTPQQSEVEQQSNEVRVDLDTRADTNEVFSKVVIEQESPTSEIVPSDLKEKSIKEHKPSEIDKSSEGGIVGECRRGFNRFLSIFSRSKIPDVEVAANQQVSDAAPKTQNNVQKEQKIEQTAADILKALKNENPTIDLTKIMNSVSREVFGDAISVIFKNPLPINQKQELRYFLTSKFPSFKNYLEFENDFSTRYFLPEGTKTLVKYLNKEQVPGKGAPLSLPCTVCEKPEKFVSLVTEASRNVDVTPQVFLIRCKHPPVTNADRLSLPEISLKEKEARSKTLSNHFTPVILQKTDDNKLVLVWTDSVSNSDYLERELNDIKTHCDNTGVELHILKLEQPRQADDHNCMAFAVNDAIGFSKNLQKLAPLTDGMPGGTRGIPMKHLPQRLFWNAQSSQAAADFRKTLSEEEQVKFDKHYMKDHVSHPHPTRPDQTMNLRAERTSDKYEGTVWKEIIQGPPGLMQFAKSLVGY